MSKFTLKPFRTLAVTSNKYKILKLLVIIIGLIIVSLIGFHFWFKANAKQMIEDLVSSKSNGKLKMKVHKFKFGYFSKKMELDRVSFYNTDTTNQATTYRFDVKKIKLNVKGLMAIVFQDKFLIDTLTLYDPDIQVTRLKRSERSERIPSRDVSIPEEMGKIYNSIQDALNVLKVSKFSILNGKFTLINKIQENQQPVSITNLDFHIYNLQIDTSINNHKNKILFSDNVTLSSHHQDITLPDSRHRLSFKYFRINLKNKSVTFDSCTIGAVKTDSSSSAFTVFFDKLRLTNIDFDTLYKAEVIKADSVYCENPTFNLKVEITKKSEKVKDPPKLENIIKQLTGDLILDNVVVKNADFNIETVNDGIPNSFTFSNNNFELTGLTIDQSAAKPLRVKQFAMAIRNYENFLKDSSYSIKFDSILFKDDRISLSNFLFEKLINSKKVNSFSIPQFFLGGLSWDDLVFERKLRADQATMFYPTIIYTVNPEKGKTGKENIFQSLGAVNEFMDLNYLEVVGGNIDLTVKKDLHLKLNNANLSIKSNSLLASKKIESLKNSLTSINFENGKLIAGDLTVELKRLRYSGDNSHFATASILITDKFKQKEIFVEDVTVDKMIVDELTGNIDAEGITWKKGSVKLDLKTPDKLQKKSVLLFKDIKGENTTIKITKGDLTISSVLQTIGLENLENYPGKAIVLNKLKAKGPILTIRNLVSNLSVSDFIIIDNETSQFKNIVFKNNSNSSTIDFSSPQIKWTPHIKQLLAADYSFDYVLVENPVVTINLKDASNSESSLLPKISINSLKLNHPIIDFAAAKNNTAFKWDGSLSSTGTLQLNDININQTKSHATNINIAILDISDFEYKSKDGKIFKSDKGNLKGELQNIKIFSSDDKSIHWNGLINTLKVKDFSFDHLGKNEGVFTLKNADINQLNISSTTIKDYKKIVADNKEFQITGFTGDFKNTQTLINWEHARLNRVSNEFSIANFAFVPAISRDTFLARQNFQKDFITFKTGTIKIEQFNVDQFVNQEILKASEIKIENAVFTDFKDKQIPFNPGLIKPLPVNLLKKIPFKIAVEKIAFENGNVTYTETGLNDHSKGVIPVTRMNIELKNIKNYNFQENDTLYVDATAFLLDTAWAHLNLRESYNDPSGGFLLRFQLRPADLTIINPVLIPLGSVKLESGYLDTLNAMIIGKEAMATGEMKMFYHDLKIKLLKDGVEPKKGLFNNFKSFLANTFVIKKNNKSKTGQVFFIRKRDRSAINYYVKIIGSGIASSIGAKNNKKAKKRYQKDLQKNK